MAVVAQEKGRLTLGGTFVVVQVEGWDTSTTNFVVSDRRDSRLNVRVLVQIIPALVKPSEKLLARRGRTVKGQRRHDRCDTTESMKSCSCKKHLQLAAAREGWQTTLRFVILQVAPKILYLLIATLIALLAPQSDIGSSIEDAVHYALEHFEQ